jgi:hypothetical protein
MSQLNLYILSFLGLTGVCAFLLWVWQRWGKHDEPVGPPAPLRPTTSRLELADGRKVEISVKPVEDGAEPQVVLKDRQVVYLQTEDGELVATAGNPPGGITAILKRRLSTWPYTLAQTLFGAALLIYALTRMVGITRYPIFFFTDEAVQTNLASDFIRDNFRNYEGELLPTYFVNVDKYSLSLTVYVQIIPYLLFGKSVLVTRLTAALLTVLAAYWVSLTLRDIFEVEYWWSGALLLAVSPAWFLHSRTAFEACLLGTLYAGFLYYYMRYRKGEPRCLYLALLVGALAFYSYNPGRVVVSLTGLLLLLSDLRYHWQQRKTGFKGLLLLALLALPFVRFYLAHPTAQIDQLRLLSSYWVSPISWQEKLQMFWDNYQKGLGPGYWFISNQQDLVRHRMDGYPQLLSQTMIFFGLGGLLSLRWLKKSPYRTLLAALLATPVGSALVSIGITRIMAFIIPAVLLTGLGLDSAMRWLERRGASALVLTVIVFMALGTTSIGLTADALVNGPTWSDEYGLTGMQYGAQQLYAKVLEYLKEDPDTRFFISPNWTNGANVVARFFLPDPMPVELGSIDGYAKEFRSDITERTFVAIPEEYEMVVESGKFKDINVLDVIPYPNGKPGFYFLKLDYADNIASILVQELEQRKLLVEDEVVVGDEVVKVRHSQLDMGEIGQLFDENPRTVTRTDASNPYVVDLYFPTIHEFSQLKAIVGSAYVDVIVDLYAPDGEVFHFSTTYHGSVDKPEATLEFDHPVQAQHLRIQVWDKTRDEPAHVHLWELELGEE